MNTQLLQQAIVLDIDEQIELVEAIWDSIVSRGATPALTETQKTELDRRLVDHLANPNADAVYLEQDEPNHPIDVQSPPDSSSATSAFSPATNSIRFSD